MGDVVPQSLGLKLRRVKHWSMTVDYDESATLHAFAWDQSVDD